MFCGTENGSYTAFVMVFEEMRAAVESCSVLRGAELLKEMALYTSRIAGNETVKKFFVVSEIEALSLQFGFEVPVGFGKEKEIGIIGFDAGYCVTPETLENCGRGLALRVACCVLGVDSLVAGPGSSEDV